jgi:hypothetical protein
MRTYDSARLQDPIATHRHRRADSACLVRNGALTASARGFDSDKCGPGAVGVDAPCRGTVGYLPVRCSRRWRASISGRRRGVYLRELMLDVRRKSMQPMAQRLRVDHQRLQQSVTASPRDVAPARNTVAQCV